MMRWLSRFGLMVDRLRRLPSTFSLQEESVLYHCRLDRAKCANLAAQAVDPVSQGSARPHLLHVGVTTVCNLKCPACPTGNDTLGRPNEHLDYDTYARVIDEMREHLMLTLFWDWGEPLLHPRITDMVAHAGKSGIKTLISTNGTVRVNPKFMGELVESGLTLICVCVDGADQETFEKYRVGGKLADALKTIELLREAKERLGVQHPVINFRVLATRDTVPQIPRLLQMAKEVGADLFTLKDFRPFDYRGHDVSREFVPLKANFSRYELTRGKPTEGLEKARVAGRLRCGKPLRAPTLNSDGRLSFCSYASHEEEFFGSLVNESFEQLWRSPRALSLRKGFLDRGGMPTCHSCYFRTDHKPTVRFCIPLRPLPDDVQAMAITDEAVLIAEAADYVASVARAD
tara:strand:+ start:766 stop:1971 length:1206 start_codon:yes stop_codon:yes gene_type:complete